MTTQEVFNRVVAHARTQKERCVGTDGSCLYRGPRGMKCFIGALIPDENYSETLESTLGSHPAVMRAAGLDPDDKEMSRLIKELQSTHDFDVLERWEDSFTHIAVRFNLNMP